jgi:hypothetical protein
MPDITITLGNPASVKLVALVQRHNQQHGTTFTPSEWLHLHVRELLIQEDLAAEMGVIERQTQQDMAVRVLAKKQELLDRV